MGRLKGVGKMKKGKENYVGKMTVGEHGVNYLKLENSLFIHFASGKADHILSFFSLRLSTAQRAVTLILII